MASIVRFETATQLITNLVDHFRGQNRTVLRHFDRKEKEWLGITYEQLYEQVTAMAGYLHSEGVRPGDRVAVLSENRPEWAIADMATQLLGAVNVALYTSLPASQVAYIINDSGASVFFVSTGIQLKKAEQILNDCPALERIVAMNELRKQHSDAVVQWDVAMEAGRTYYDANEETIDELTRAVTPEDVSALIYTSGTTGNPKGVMLTHGNFCSNVNSALSLVPFGPEDHHLSFLPLCHSFERTAGYLCVLACGARITYAQSVDTVSRDLIDVKPTVMISVPRLFEKVYNAIAKSVDEGSALKQRIFHWSVAAGMSYASEAANGGAGPVSRLKKSVADRLVFSKLHEKLGGNLRFAVSGGAALPKAIGEFFQAAGVTIIEGYGLTETSPVLCINPIDAPRYGTVGHVIGGVTVGIQDLSTGELVGQIAGEEYPTAYSCADGEIVAKGPNIMKGYWGNDDATRESIDRDGWYHTGDVGRFDGGYLMITDRIKHMIVSKGGKNIYPGPIEEIFKTEPLIDQIMVVGEGREFLTALVVPDEDGVVAFAKEHQLKPSEARESESLKDVYRQIFRSYSKGAAAHEKIRDFRIVDEAFTVDNGLMTPTMKLRRKQIERIHADTIDGMYAGIV